MNAVTTIDKPSRALDAQRIICSQPLKLLPSKSGRELADDARNDPQFSRDLSRECMLAIHAAESATTAEIGVMLHRLSLHYPDRKLNPKEAALVAQDWLQDLDGIPHDLIELAFKRWRTGPKCAFFPKPGEILALVNHEVAVRRLIAKRAREVESSLRGEPQPERDQQVDQAVQRIIEGRA